MDKPNTIVEQLRNYLYTGLKVQIERENEQLYEISLTHHQLVLITDEYHFNPKPICYRLSDLHNVYQNNVEKSVGDSFGFNEKFLKENILALETGNMRLHYYKMLWIFHFWTGPQEYFDQGLVIDKLQYGKEVPNG